MSRTDDGPPDRRDAAQEPEPGDAERGGAVGEDQGTGSAADVEPGAGDPEHTDAERAEAEQPKRRGRTGVLGAVRETVIVVGTALVLSLLIKTFLVQAFFIPSESMEQTLVRGDRVLVSQLHPGLIDLQRGDVVVFRDPGGWLNEEVLVERDPISQGVVNVLTFVGVLPQDAGEHLIKRLIGLPGDRVACCDDQGRMTVNGDPLGERYLAPGASPSERAFDVQVPEGRIWVMGDNRQSSRDSRWHTDLEGGGTVAEELVVGRAFVTIWPVDRWSWLGNFPDVFADVPAPGASSSDTSD